jgi:zinc transporter ZupT
LPISLLVVPVLSTLLGGMLALRLRSSLGLVIAFSTGLLLAAALLDLLPEAVSLQRLAGRETTTAYALVLISFVVFLLLQNVFATLGARLNLRASPRTWGRIGGGLLIAHSFRDGMAIGLSYAASRPAGYIVAAGIAAHDIGDGVNTILLSTRGHEPERFDYLLLAADSLAPMAGGLLTAWLPLSTSGSAALLAITAGFFLHMVADELLPQLRADSTPRILLGLAVTAGALLIFVATRLAG